KYGTALTAASLKGHTQIGKLLLDKGANVNMVGGHYGTASSATSLKGHSQTPSLLL
ncbi:hypothetical protein C8R45DRAFT_797892, partial [Mycena sanguinolenta]